jgi:hypothetical protein
LDSQPPFADSEEFIPVPRDELTHYSSHVDTQLPTNASNVPAVSASASLPVGDVSPHLAANTVADRSDDDRDVVVQDHPVETCGVVTQDENVSPDVLDCVAHQLSRTAEDSTDDELFTAIEGHEWVDGVLRFRVRWTTDEISEVPFTLMQRDYPSETASYILTSKVRPDGSRFTSGRHTRWARQYTRLFNKIVRRLVRLSDGVEPATTSERSISIATNLPDGTRLIRRVVHAVGKSGGTRKRKKPGRLSRPVQMKYGVVIPRNVKHAYELDKESGTTFWADAIKKEVDSLLALNCFTFHDPGYKPSPDYQFAKLSMIFEVKQDGRRKARLVAGGHMIDPMGINSRSTVVKGISVRLLDLIAHRDHLQVLCGDIGNAFITAECLEKVYSRAGPEFGDREESVLVFKKALYGLRSSSRAFRGHFADFLRGLGFSASRYDRDVWMREREERDGYDYICTHVDNFKIVARNPT